MFVSQLVNIDALCVLFLIDYQAALEGLKDVLWLAVHGD
jgi:hypothetical protein